MLQGFSVSSSNLFGRFRQRLKQLPLRRELLHDVPVKLHVQAVNLRQALPRVAPLLRLGMRVAVPVVLLDDGVRIPILVGVALAGGEVRDALLVDGVALVDAQEEVEPVHALLEPGHEAHDELGRHELLGRIEVVGGQFVLHRFPDEGPDHEVGLAAGPAGPLLERHARPSGIVRRLPSRLLKILQREWHVT